MAYRTLWALAVVKADHFRERLFSAHFWPHVTRRSRSDFTACDTHAFYGPASHLVSALTDNEVGSLLTEITAGLSRSSK